MGNGYPIEPMTRLQNSTGSYLRVLFVVFFPWCPTIQTVISISSPTEKLLIWSKIITTDPYFRSKNTYWNYRFFYIRSDHFTTRLLRRHQKTRYIVTNFKSWQRDLIRLKTYEFHQNRTWYRHIGFLILFTSFSVISTLIIFFYSKIDHTPLYIVTFFPLFFTFSLYVRPHFHTFLYVEALYLPKNAHYFIKIQWQNLYVYIMYDTGSLTSP